MTNNELLDMFNADLRLFNLWVKKNYVAELKEYEYSTNLAISNEIPGSLSYTQVSCDEEGLLLWWSMQFALYGQYIDRAVLAILFGSWLEDTVTALLTGLYAANQPNVKALNAMSRLAALQKLREVY